MNRISFLFVSIFFSAFLYGDLIVPIVSHADGACGSVWRTDLIVWNDCYGSEVSCKLIFTERNQSMSDEDPTLSLDLPLYGPEVLDDVYSIVFPGKDGAARILLQGDEQCIKVMAYTYHLGENDGKYGMQIPALSINELFSEGDTVGFFSSIFTSERDSLFIMTGSDGATIEWSYSSYPFPVTKQTQYAPNMTYQHFGGIKDIFGGEPPLFFYHARIIEGSAHIAASHSNNITNDGRWEEAFNLFNSDS